MSSPIGDLLDARGVTASLKEDDLVTDILVLMKVVKADGGIALMIGSSEGMDYVNELGLLTAAIHIINEGYYEEGDEDPGLD